MQTSSPALQAAASTPPPPTPLLWRVVRRGEGQPPPAQTRHVSSSLGTSVLSPLPLSPTQGQGLAGQHAGPTLLHPPPPRRGVAGLVLSCSSSSGHRHLPPLFPSELAMPSVFTVSAWQPGSGRGSPSSSGQKARRFTSPAGPGQQHPLQLGQGPRRRRPGGDQTRNVWLQSSCGESHVAADQLQPSLGSSSSNSFACRLSQPLQPAAPTPRSQHQLPARQRQQHQQ